MKTKVFTLAALLCCASAMYAQESGYKFTTVASQKATPVKNQASTGTCWCFATTSFMESELLRMGKGEYDLSEMFIVRQKYLNQLEDNYYRLTFKEISGNAVATSMWNSNQEFNVEHSI